MSLRTPFTELLSVEHPLALAPMGGSAGGALAAAVSSAGGLGLVGGGRGDLAFLQRELAIVSSQSSRPWGVGFLTWSIGSAALEEALSAGPAAVMLSFGDPTPFAGAVKDSPAKLIVQVTDLDEARQALDVGADVIVAQGDEAGGHGGGGRGTMAFVPSVVDLVEPTPVLAAGGIADGRGLAAALMLGAAGALVGSRFQASAEALVSEAMTRAIIDGHGEQTERSRLLDIARGAPWPERYPARTLRNAFLDEWRGREAELASSPEARAAYGAASEQGDLATIPVWTSEATDLIRDAPPAAELVRRLVDEAEGALRAY